MVSKGSHWGALKYVKPQVSLIQGKTARIYLYLSVVKHADREGAESVVGRERIIRHFIIKVL